MYKIDLHTHSTLSYDGSISLNQYRNILDKGILDYIAITDHNEINFAINAKKELGDKIIIGEEVLTKQGEVIGLFLKEHIPPYLSITKTIALIKDQGGVVYIPHPFDVLRKGISKKIYLDIEKSIDIIEIYNQKGSWFPFNKKVNTYFQGIKINKFAGSDSHNNKQLGHTYTILDKKPTKEYFKSLIYLDETQINTSRIPLHHLFVPKANSFKKLLNISTYK